MALARRLTSLGRAARSEAGVKVRQPLSRALVFLPPDAPAILHDIVAEELNVDEIDVADELSEVLEFELSAELPDARPPPEGEVKYLKPALAALDGVEAAAALEAGRSITLDLPGGPVELGPDDVQLRVRGQQGFAVSREGGEVVALDLTLDDSLRHRGLAREVVRLVQDLRKNSGLDVSDRIHLHLEGLDMIAGALRLHRPRGPGRLHRDRARARARERCSSSRPTRARFTARAWLRKADGRSSRAARVGAAPDSASRGVRAWTAPFRAARSVSSSGATRWRSIPSMCAPMALPQGGLPGGGQHDVDAAPVRRAVLAGHQPGLDHAVHQPGHAARGQGHLGAQPAHGQAALLGPADVDEHVEPDQGDADGLLELACRAG